MIDVLSDSTRATEFLIKLKDYRSVPDIQAYLIFWQDEARLLLHRRPGQGWSSSAEILGLDSVVPLETLDMTLSLHQIHGERFAAQ